MRREHAWLYTCYKEWFKRNDYLLSFVDKNNGTDISISFTWESHLRVLCPLLIPVNRGDK